jgi:hypothetical protein
LKSKLLLIEGLPGSGKTTTAKISKEVLDELGIKNKLFLEGNLDHPADYEGVAFFNKFEYFRLKEAFNECNDLIENISKKREAGYFISYVKHKRELEDDFPDELFNYISKKDIYELSLEKNKELIYNNWKRFTKRASEEETVYIFECCFIQNPITITMIRDNASKENAFNYINNLLEAVKSLNPILLYIKQDDLIESFKKVVEERPKKWFNSFIDYYTGQGYGLKENLNGLKGTIEVLKYRQEIEDEIFTNLNMEKYLLNNSNYNKNQTKLKIKSILKEQVANND